MLVLSIMSNLHLNANETVNSSLPSGAEFSRHGDLSRSQVLAQLGKILARKVATDVPVVSVTPLVHEQQGSAAGLVNVVKGSDVVGPSILGPNLDVAEAIQVHLLVVNARDLDLVSRLVIHSRGRGPVLVYSRHVCRGI